MSNILRQHIEEFAPLTDEEFALVLSHFTSKKFKKHQIIIREGEYVHNDYYLISGLMKVCHVDAEGKEHIIQFGMEHCWITDPQAYHNQTTATLQVDCLEDCDTLFITLQNREKLCRELQKMEHFFRKKTTDQYIQMQRRILCLISCSVKDQYEHLITNYPSLFQRVPKSLIASFLGVSRETLSRLASA
ncbi:Crp/Fnr family transcriptional regulator [Niastella yeongjuensis]|uniref:Crp/Fnr family transcriptional regulator n=1 Tax=Niastella yeongjuensis TaxID=354355 RepID=A0A1V9F536_9BACT|nr:Crp/Fnr family transcriptional regulator [Niastella yeongjuensis]OQP53395.1 Crp/Fnr family transcriptional regulator [Niastella yeongjuensis]SEP13356.1 cAMP-binding domain of CRP or a regulatory subunit of cAMP-dependent protein kinases [Niastella yeongjuensis]